MQSSDSIEEWCDALKWISGMMISGMMISGMILLY